MSVDQVANMIGTGECEVFDANRDATRKEFGVVRRAKLLGSSSQYDTSMLPADLSKQLIFYCANEQCGASHTAATRAAEAGHKQVAVLRAGIKGWKEAGQKTEQPSS